MTSQSVLFDSDSETNVALPTELPQLGRRLIYPAFVRCSLPPVESSGSMADAPSDEDDFHRAQRHTSEPIPKPASSDLATVSHNGRTQSQARRNTHANVRTHSFAVDSFANNRTGSTLHSFWRQTQNINGNSSFNLRTGTPDRHAAPITTDDGCYSMYSHHGTAGTLHTTSCRGIEDELYHVGIDRGRLSDRCPNEGILASSRRRDKRINSTESVDCSQQGQRCGSIIVESRPFNLNTFLNTSTKLRTLMYCGLYLATITLTTDILKVAKLTKSRNAQISIQRKAAYGIGYGREIPFPLDTTSKPSRLENTNTIEDNVEPSKGEQQEEPIRTTTLHTDTGHKLRQPQLAYARTSIHKAAPIFHPGEPLLNLAQAKKRQTVRPVERFFFQDLGPVGALRDDAIFDDTSFLALLSTYVRLVAIAVITFMLFIGLYREAKRRWGDFQVDRVRLQSQRSR